MEVFWSLTIYHPYSILSSLFIETTKKEKTMGGGGLFYDRDVTDKAFRGSSGVSSVAERELRQTNMDPALLPKNRKLICNAKNPLVYDFDVTGSMGNLPKIIYDKWPGIVGQIVARKYLADPQMSVTATGDTRSDRSPLQMADFSNLRNLDKWLKSIHFEGNGGGQGSESYAMTAYYYAYLCDLPKAENPIYLITGDEAFVEDLLADDLKEYFGGECQDTTAKKVFADLLAKFKDNVFLIHRRYDSGGSERWTNTRIVNQWQGVIGKERIIPLPEDLAIGDITLGVYAIVSGARTLKQYLEDMCTRPLDLGEGVEYEPQSEERIAQVDEALQLLKDFKPVKSTRPTVTVSRKTKPADKKEKSGKKQDSSWKI
ncbi:MAG: hypothetical protein Q8Q89_01345 [bacterium]|nr:hypothetical protein [bacterium]